MIDEEIFTTQEAAEFAGVCTRTLRRWANKEGMRTEKRKGKCRTYFKSELHKYMHRERKRLVRKVTAMEVKLLFKEVDASIAALNNIKSRLEQILG